MERHMRLRMLLIFFVACAEPHTSTGEHKIGGTHCADPARCDNSEPAVGSMVAPAGRAEQWRPAPTQSLEEIIAAVTDDDGDGIPVALDCDDHDPKRYPQAPDTLCDGIDQNCDGWDSCDADHDGFVDNADCDPNDPKVTDQCRPKIVPQPLL